MNEKMEDWNNIRNIVPYTCIHIYTPISMWSGFMWIHGKLKVPEIQLIGKKHDNEYKYIERKTELA